VQISCLIKYKTTVWFESLSITDLFVFQTWKNY